MRYVTLMGWASVWLGVGGTVRTISAQESGTSSDDTLPIPFSETTFAHYTMPAECALTHAWLDTIQWRDKRLDTVFIGKDGMPYAPSTQGTIHRCAVRFSVVGTATRDLLGLGQAALAAGDEARADSVFTQLARVMAHHPIAARAWTDYQIADVYLAAPVPHVANAAALIAKLDAMAPSVAAIRLSAHLELASEAQRRDSVPLWDHEASAAVTASRELVGEDRDDEADDVMEAYLLLAQVQARENKVEAARATIVAGRAAVPSLVGYFDAAASWYAPQGQPAPPLDPTQWTNAGPPGTIHPMPHKATLLAFVSVNCQWPACDDHYGVLRRVITKYPSSVLDLVFVTRTEGYIGSRLVPPDTEMARIGDYFVNNLHFPAAVAVTKTVFDTRADDRRVPERTNIEQAYQVPHGAAYYGPDRNLPITVCLVDSHGVIRFYTTLSRQNEMVLDDLLEAVTLGEGETNALRR